MIKARKKVKKLTVDGYFLPDEPTFDGKLYISKVEIAESLNWYASQKTAKDSKAYTISYMKKNKYDNDKIETIFKCGEGWFNNLGFVCRMIDNGAPLDNYVWVNNKINTLIEIYKRDKEPDVAPTNVISIQDRVFNQCTKYIDELENIVDSFVKTKHVDFNVYSWLITNNIKGIYARQIADHFRKDLGELQAVLDRTDPDLVEGYSNFTTKEIRQYIKFLSSIISDCEMLTENKKRENKPRKKAPVSADKKVSKLKYKKFDPDLQISSVNPVDIIGAKIVWLFNTKYRKLCCVIATDESGLSVKGTTIEDFSDESSQKIVKKPNEVLPAILKSGKRDFKKVFDSIKNKPSSITGRVNSDVIILKAFK